MLSLEEMWDNRKGLVIAGGLAVGAGAVAALDTFKAIDSGHFGVHTRLGRVINDTIAPKVVWKYPFVDKVHQFQNNTIILETTAGTGRNTKEQNMLSAKMRLHYRIDPSQGVLALHIKKMSDDNGGELLEGLMDQSFDAVVGERHSSEHMADPQALLIAFAQNFDWRQRQNNVPTSVEAIELLEATIGDGSNPYRTPLQLRIRRTDSKGNSGWIVEQMAGPAALPVQSAGQVIKPREDAINTSKDTLTLKP